MQYFKVFEVSLVTVMARTIEIQNLNSKLLSGCVGHIGFYRPGIFKGLDFPIPTTLCDQEEKNLVEVNLMEYVPFRDIIPTVFKWWVFGKDLEDREICAMLKVNTVDNLAFYLYANRNQNPDPLLS